MRSNGRSVLVLLLALAVSACTSSGGSNSPDVAETGTYETRPGTCSGLSQEECEASDECEPYLARLPESACPYPEVPMPEEFFGCHGAVLCSLEATWAHPADSPDDWHLFNDTCLPDGWVSGDRDDACGTSCDGLDQAECEASDECEPYLAWPKELACVTGEPAEPPSFVACGSFVERVCSGNWTWAHNEGDPDDWRLFSGGCVPKGWAKGEGADLVCDAQPCEGLPQADCETTYHCFPIFGVPLLDGCTWGESEYAGCWTSSKLEDGEVAAFPCATVVTWAHPADAPDEWYVFADSCVPDGWVSSEVDPCAPVCPGTHPWLTDPQSWKCDLPDGTVCSWPAEGCEPGQKPDNICTCVEYGGKMHFDCERPFHNCLPLEGADVPEGTLTRPVPKHREVAEACESTLEPRLDPTCTPSQPGGVDPENECTSDADCEGDGARCLDAWQGMGETLCTCHVPQCFEDAECPGTAVCSCGKTENSGSMHCEGPGGQSCLHECLPSDCQTDADCGDGKFCSPSWDDCGWQKVGYHCHDPEVAECFSAWECMGADHWGCNFEKGKGWVCQEIPMCD